MKINYIILFFLSISILSHPVSAEGNVKSNVSLFAHSPEWELISSNENTTTFLFNTTIEIWNNSALNETIWVSDSRGFTARIRSTVINIKNFYIGSYTNLYEERTINSGITIVQYLWEVVLPLNTSVLPIGTYQLYPHDVYDATAINPLKSYGTTIEINPDGIIITPDELPTDWGNIPTTSVTEAIIPWSNGYISLIFLVMCTKIINKKIQIRFY